MWVVAFVNLEVERVSEVVGELDLDADSVAFALFAPGFEFVPEFFEGSEFEAVAVLWVADEEDWEVGVVFANSLCRVF